MSKRVQVTLPDSVYNKASVLANEREESLSAFVKYCVVLYLNAYEKHQRGTK